MKLSDYVIDFLARRGVQHAFILPGGGSMHLVDSVGKSKDLQFICCLHEVSCAFAAEAYAEYTNRLGVAIVTTGPGGTYCVTGVACAWIESSGGFFISGQAKRADMLSTRGVRSMGQQEVDIVSIVRPITKYAVSVMSPESIRYHLEKAAYLATHGRSGPVWIEIPLDVQASQIDETKLVGYNPQEPRQETPEDLRQDVENLIRIIRNSERPVFLVGNGVRSARAIDELHSLLEQVQIPVLLTWKAIDMLPEGHPLYRGRPGGIGQRGANFTQQNSDCIIVIGARLDLPSLAFSHKYFARAAARVMVDIDAAEILKMTPPVDLGICGDAGAFLREFRNQSSALAGYTCRPWLDRTAEWQVRYPVVLPEYRKPDLGFVSTYVLVDLLSNELTPDDLIVPGSAGPCSDILMQAFKVKAGQRIMNAPGLGSMGTGLPATIGACLAANRRRTICVIGDGGFQQSIQELETVRRLDLPIKYFVLNNQGYSSIASTQRNHFQGRLVATGPESGLTLPDVKKVAAAYGIKTDRLAENADIKEAIRRVLAADGPVVCEVMVSPVEETAPRVASALNARGEISSKPMEDMSPLLERAEFLANMIIPPLD